MIAPFGIFTKFMELGRTFYTTKGVNLEKYHLLSNVKKTYNYAFFAAHNLKDQITTCGADFAN